MYYFVSDTHLGLGGKENSLTRERLFIKWLREVNKDAEAIFIVGDMFDFWFEYKRVIPKGFSRLLGTLSELTDKGTNIHFFPGNHDMSAYDYLKTECGATVHHDPEVFDLYGKRIYVAHGDRINARNAYGARLINSIFRSRLLRWLFSHLIHPGAAMRLGQWWSGHSRKAKKISHRFLGESEPMVGFARNYTGSEKIDYFIFGHNHCAEIYPLGNGQSVAFLGEWIENATYVVLKPDGQIELKDYKSQT